MEDKEFRKNLEDILESRTDGATDSNKHDISIQIASELLELLLPEENKCLMQVPRLCRSISDNLGRILNFISHSGSLDKATEIAKDANVLLSGINDSFDVFFEKHS